MAWRGLHLTRPARLSYADGQVVVAQDDGVVRLAVEDVAWIVLDTRQTTVTGALLSACMAGGVAVVATDATHTPCGILLPFHRHHRQAEIAQRQASMGKPLRKRLWQAVVRRKIENQGDALARTGRGGRSTLHAMARQVGSGDPGNVEARAARYYWSQLWPEFRREDTGDRRNKLINYGYAVMRSGVARALVASGLLPCFGLNHASATNAFNLADDLVEPFRPFVDVIAWHAVGGGQPSRSDLSLPDRQAMAGCLLSTAHLGADEVTLLVAAERVAESLVRAIEASSAESLGLPAFAA